MDYELTETQEEVKALAYQVALRDIKPVREKHDEEVVISRNPETGKLVGTRQKAN
jgi:hypothetical protein